MIQSEQPEHLHLHCAEYGKLHEELSKAEDKDLLHHHYHSVEWKYTELEAIHSIKNLKFEGFVRFPFTWESASRTPRLERHEDFIDRVQRVVKHITTKYGKYLVAINYGPVGVNYELTYTWNSIVP